MQELWNVLLRVAAIPALICAVVAVYYLAAAYRSRRAGRSALFDAERQVTADRMMRSALAGLGLLGLAVLFSALALIGTGNLPASEPSTRVPTRTVTPRTGTTPGAAATPTLVTTSSLPTVPPPPAATNTRRPIVTTPTSGRKTAVVTGTAEAGGLKLRTSPPTGDVIDSLPDGTVVELLGETRTEAGLEWQKVRDPKGREGWVAGQYLIINP